MGSRVTPWESQTHEELFAQMKLFVGLVYKSMQETCHSQPERNRERGNEILSALLTVFATLSQSLNLLS